ncbi:PepSY-associated TM helix domain-containing protein, partial [Methylophilus sp.]
LHKSSRVFWRDLHAVSGFWISFFTLFLLISGLPWTKSWGGMLKEIRQVQTVSTHANAQAQSQDWTTGGVAPGSVAVGGVSAGDHAGHADHTMAEHTQHQTADYRLLDHLVATVTPLQLAAPVLIAPPSEKAANWTARSDAQNRPLRVNISFDADGNISSRKNFADRPWLDRVIGLGVAIHEGQLFGWLNQALGALTALGLILLCVSGVVLWWKRLTKTSLLHTLGAPPGSRQRLPYAWAMIAMVLVLGVLLPFFGLSLLLVLVIERCLMPYFPVLASYLGLHTTAP